jgi:hypothetical protein
MYTLKQLHEEIASEIALLIESEQVLEPDWITNAVMKEHPQIEGPDVDFYNVLTRSLVRKEVTAEINRIGGKDKTNEQLPLEGFPNLQMYYVIERQGVLVGVPIEKCTNEELRRKQREIGARIATEQLHFDALGRFIENRRLQA